MNYPTLNTTDVKNKTVLIRADMNVPIKNGVIGDDTRIRASLDSIRYCLDNGAGVIVMTHLGRPTEGQFQPEDDVAPVAERLAALLGQPVKVVNDWRQGALTIQAGEVVMLQNVRLNAGEKKNDANLGAAYAALADVYVNDAFGTAHRAEASTHAVAQAVPVATAGLLLDRELQALSQALSAPKRPLLAIVGGSKISTKLTILESLAQKVDSLIVGGGIANTFLLAKGHSIGQSLAEPDLVDEAKKIMARIESQGGQLPLPTDVVCAKAFAADAPTVVKSVDAIEKDDMILDIGPESAARLAALAANAGTLVWNGPVGVFEFPDCAHGTHALAQAIAQSAGFSIAGGGDTLSAIAQFGLEKDIDYISTGGGAFLEFLEGKTLPAVAALEARA